MSNLGKKWQLLYEDNPGGKYMRRLDAGLYHVLEWTDMDDACGRDNEGQPRYAVELSEVDLWYLTPKGKEGVLRSCGWEGMDHNNDEHLAECCHSYGRRAPLHDVMTNNLSEGIAECKRVSSKCTNPHHREELLNHTVNALGSTAREFMQGDFFSAMTRGVRAGDDRAKLMAKMHGIPDDVVATVAVLPAPTGAVACTANFGRAKREGISDPIPYLMGFMAAVSGKGPEQSNGLPKDSRRRATPASRSGGTKRSQLAASYRQGFTQGIAVRAGEAEVPDWIK